MKDKIIVITFILIIFLFPIISIVKEDREVSNFERRKLTTINKLEKAPLDNLEKYLSDQFPLRDSLIKLNSTIDRYVLGNKESNDVYIKEEFLIDKNYPQDDKSINNFINKMNYLNDTYLKNSNTFIAIIPDKAYYLDDNYLKIDYNSIYKELEKELNINYINIKDLFNLNDYYKTDIHLKQSSYFKLIEELNKKYDFNYEKVEYNENNYKEFIGSSYSKSTIFTKKENLTYLSNNIIDNTSVHHLEYGARKVYDIDKLGGTDSYDVFLSGPSALIEIENNSSTTDKELIIFRDSFSSSLAPLLIPYYKKATLIDLRYIRNDLLIDKVDYQNKDVLILFSTLIVNKSYTLKINNK